MADQVSMLSATQSSFLSSLADTKDKEVITGFDTFAAAQICTPSFFGCRVCVGANVVGGAIALTIQANTPVGGFSKSFKITKNISFTWNPIGVFKVEVKISNFRKTGGSFSFTVSIKGCIKIPFLGWKCKSISKTFSIPTSLSSAQVSILNSKADDDDDVSADNQQYATLLLLSAMMDKEDECNCDNDD